MQNDWKIFYTFDILRCIKRNRQLLFARKSQKTL